MQENVMPIYNAQVEVNYTKEKEEVKRMGKRQRKMRTTAQVNKQGESKQNISTPKKHKYARKKISN